VHSRTMERVMLVLRSTVTYLLDLGDDPLPMDD
jgi:hypothetical protein